MRQARTVIASVAWLIVALVGGDEIPPASAQLASHCANISPGFSAFKTMVYNDVEPGPNRVLIVSDVRSIKIGSMLQILKSNPKTCREVVTASAVSSAGGYKIELRTNLRCPHHYGDIAYRWFEGKFCAPLCRAGESFPDCLDACQPGATGGACVPVCNTPGGPAPPGCAPQCPSGKTPDGTCLRPRPGASADAPSGGPHSAAPSSITPPPIPPPCPPGRTPSSPSRGAVCDLALRPPSSGAR